MPYASKRHEVQFSAYHEALRKFLAKAEGIKEGTGTTYVWEDSKLVAAMK